jgi:hypothetical protein
MNTTTVTNSDAHWSALGGLWMAYGISRLVVAALLVSYSAVATVMFGALLVRVSDALHMMAIFHFFYLLAILVTILSGLCSVFAGLSLLGRRSPARFFSIAASFLSVSDIPFGTTLGIYTLILFLR